VQNTNDSTEDISIELMAAGSSSATVTKTLYDVQENSSQMIDLSGSDYAAFEGMYGSASVSAESGGSVAVIALYVRNTGTTASEINGQYRAMPVADAGREWYAPIVYKNHNGWVTGINVVNTEAVSTTVRAVYTASAQSAYAGTVVTETIIWRQRIGRVSIRLRRRRCCVGLFRARPTHSDSSDVQVTSTTQLPAQRGSVASAMSHQRRCATDTVAAR
jgi:hypothetical protein